MTTLKDLTVLAGAVDQAIESRVLLQHPFYRRWERGELTRSELTEYAVHYRAFEEALPVILADVAAELRAQGGAGVEAAEMVERNLADELGRPEAHLTLFDEFAAALGGDAVATRPGPAAEALVATYRHLVSESPVAALAGLAAYETQASDIAATKGEGLRRWYGMDAEGTRFWDVHTEQDAAHGAWAVEALAELEADPAIVTQAASRAAEAWWLFLDERQAEAAQAA